MFELMQLHVASHLWDSLFGNTIHPAQGWRNDIDAETFGWQAMTRSKVLVQFGQTELRAILRSAGASRFPLELRRLQTLRGGGR